MIKHYLFFLSLFFIAGAWTDAAAQSDNRLIAYFSFDSCGVNGGPDYVNESGNSGNAIVQGDPGCGCGVKGSAIQLDGIDDQILLVGFSEFFRTTDITISFYIKSTSSFGTQSLLSKRADCGEDNALAISYTPSSNFLNVLVSEDSGKKVGINEQLSFDDCWHHVVLVRDGGRVTLYVNGTEMGDGSTNSRIDLTSSGTLTFGNGPCTNTTENPFSGLIDELRIYSRPLTRTEIEDLYLLPDRIGNRDTLIFLGGEVPAFVPNTCADNFMWSPAATASDPDSRNPILTPTETTTYTLQASDAICNAIDTLRVTVVDPSELDCNQTFVPNAFTPNGDGRNEIFKISNPFAIDLISFEIYDRQGGRVFATESAFEGWNGVFKGQDMNPGVLLYRIRFRCNGEEEVSFGSFTLIR